MKVFKLFIASPGDTREDRELIRRVGDEFNRIYAAMDSLVLISGWEDVPGQYGEPQDQINPLIVKANGAIVLFREKWGNPPRLDTVHTAGTEEEYCVAKARSQSDSSFRLALLFYRPSVSSGQNYEPDERVLSFRRSVETNKEALYHEYKDLDDLAFRIRQYLAAWIIRPEIPTDSEIAPVTDPGCQKSFGALLEANNLLLDRRQAEAERAIIEELLRNPCAPVCSLAAGIFEMGDKLDIAETLGKKAIDKAGSQTKKCRFCEGQANWALGRIYDKQGRPYEALQAYKKAVKYYKTEKEQQHLGRLLQNRARVELGLKRPRRALCWARIARERLKETTRDYMIVNGTIGDALDQLGHYAEAVEAYDLKIAAAGFHGESILAAGGHADKAVSLRRLGRLQEALSINDSALAILGSLDPGARATMLANAVLYAADLDSSTLDARLRELDLHLRQNLLRTPCLAAYAFGAERFFQSDLARAEFWAKAGLERLLFSPDGTDDDAKARLYVVTAVADHSPDFAATASSYARRAGGTPLLKWCLNVETLILREAGRLDEAAALEMEAFRLDYPNARL